MCTWLFFDPDILHTQPHLKWSSSGRPILAQRHLLFSCFIVGCKNGQRFRHKQFAVMPRRYKIRPKLLSDLRLSSTTYTDTTCLPVFDEMGKLSAFSPSPLAFPDSEKFRQSVSKPVQSCLIRHAGGEGGIDSLRSGLRPKACGFAHIPPRLPLRVRRPFVAHRHSASPNGGEGGIRTLGRLAPTHDFQSCAFDHSATSP